MEATELMSYAASDLYCRRLAACYAKLTRRRSEEWAVSLEVLPGRATARSWQPNRWVEVYAPVLVAFGFYFYAPHAGL